MKKDRAAWPRAAENPALFLNRRGGRLSARAVDQLLDALAADADLVDDDGAPAASAHTIRHTFGTNLLRNGTNIVTVAELMGHRRSTPRVSTPGPLSATSKTLSRSSQPTSKRLAEDPVRLFLRPEAAP